jgi:hypothetical protein
MRLNSESLCPNRAIRAMRFPTLLCAFARLQSSWRASVPCARFCCSRDWPGLSLRRRELLLSSTHQGFFISQAEFFIFRAGWTSCTLLWSSAISKGMPMSMQSHLAELERRHKALEKEIESEKLHPAADDLRVVEMKRKKLFLKDQIVKLRSRSDEPERTLH